MNHSKKIYNLIFSLKLENRRNIKIDYLKRFKNDNIDTYPIFFKLCQYVMNPLKVYYIKHYDYVDIESNQKYTIEDILSENGILEKLHNREITGHAALHEFQKVLSNTDCLETKFLLECCIRKTFDVGADLKTFNKAFGEVIYLPKEFMLAEAATEELVDDFFKYDSVKIAQLKLDAMRCEVNYIEGKIVFITRGDNVLFTNNIPLDDILSIPFKNAIELYARYGYTITEIFLDGEIIFHKEGKRLSRKKSNGIANSLITKTDTLLHSHDFEVVVWDIITKEEKNKQLSIPYRTRLDILNELIKGISNYTMIESIVVNNKKEAIQMAIEYINKGEEGIVLKLMDNIWEGKRLNTQIKLKAIRQAEIRIVGINLSTEKKYKGKVGSLICKTDDGLLKVDVSGMSDDERVEFLKDEYIGKIITVSYTEVIQNSKGEYSLFLGRLEEVRLDKNDTDTLEYFKTCPFLLM